VRGALSVVEREVRSVLLSHAGTEDQAEEVEFKVLRGEAEVALPLPPKTGE